MRLPSRADRFRPALDAWETHDAIVLQVELAGVRPEDVRVIVDGEFVQISGRRAARYEAPPRRHLQLEIAQGSFERVVRLRAPYDSDGVTAALDDGILTIRFPLRGTVTPRSIPVKS